MITGGVVWYYNSGMGNVAGTGETPAEVPVVNAPPEPPKVEPEPQAGRLGAVPEARAARDGPADHVVVPAERLAVFGRLPARIGDEAVDAPAGEQTRLRGLGHRLGLLLKADLARWLREVEPQPVRLVGRVEDAVVVQFRQAFRFVGWDRWWEHLSELILALRPGSCRTCHHKTSPSA